jgi:hypothetical protein
LEEKQMEIKTYSTDSGELNIASELLINAGVTTGSDISVLVADGALIIVAAEDIQREITDELACFMEEIGYDPEEIFTVQDEDEACDYDDV